ncbi:MAG: PAS domain S-box protein, partial [Gallionella sp.]
MPTKPANPKQLLAENAGLRASLEKAEATLREILSGDSDALFVSGEAGAQMFTLKGADHSYRILIESMSEGALTLTPEGLVLYANRRFAGMLRMPLEKVIGSEINTWFAPESRQILQTLLRKDAVDNRREELSLAAADGTRVPVYLSVSRLHQDGMPDSLCMVATDLTEQKRNEAILAADKLEHAILEQAADAIVICDETGRIIRASKQAQSFYGQDMIGQQFEQVFPLRQSDGTAFLPVGAIDTDRRQSVEARLTHNGQGFDFLVSVGHLKGAQNELLGSVVTLTDITERRQTEAAHKRLSTELRVLFDLMPAMIWFKDTENGILRVNQHVADAAGMRVEEIEGKPTVEIYPENAAKFFADDLGVIDAGVPKLGIIETLPGPHGEQHWVQTDKVPYHGPDGKVIGIVVMAQDITKRKQAELVLRESERRFSDLLENIEMVSVMRDREERITYCNEYLLHLSGWKREEVIGRNWVELFLPPEIAEEKKMLFAELLLDKLEARHHESEILTRTGNRRLIHWNNSVLRSAEGEVIGTASIGEDITVHKQAEESLRKLSLAVEQSPSAVVITDLDANIEYANKAFYKITGYSQAEVIGQNPRILHSGKTPKATYADMWAHLTNGQDWKGEFINKRKDGSEYTESVLLSPVRQPGGKATHYLAIKEDITERKAAEAKIIYLNRVYAVLSGINTLIVRGHDSDELFREACRIAVETGGFRMAMLVMMDQSTMRFVPVASVGVDEELLIGIKEYLASSEHTLDTIVALAIRDKQPVVSNDLLNDPRVVFGKKYIESGARSMVILPLIISDEAVGALALYAGEIEFFHNEEMQLLAELAGDIAFAIDYIKKQEQLNYLAYYDVLTGLANRTLFLERVTQYMRSAASGGHQVAIGLIDLERFKNINDSMGRSAGNALLKQVATWMVHRIGDASLLARIDADHFAIVLPEVRSDGNLAGLVESLRAAFMLHEFRLNDVVLRIGIKVGVAVFPDDGADIDTLFRNAEAALKMAKKSGDRYLFHTKKMTEAVAGKLALENQLRQAIDNGEFVLYYQPKVNLASGRVTSAEALIRWNDPSTGLVPPDKFIPLLEETGLIYEVGRWALRQAIADNLRWRNAGLPAVRIAVNVSALQLRNPGFIAEIEQALAIDTHVAEGLELEITESMIMEDIQHNIAGLEAIRAMGISIAIDDFGTGFSSLSYLAKLPVNTLKIDRSFVIDMTVDSEGLALVSTIIGLAHALHLKVVAEGVETEDQAHLLRLLSCDEMQGFLFSKPVPA